MRRFITVILVAAATSVGSLYWLHDGDLEEAVNPWVEDAKAQWNAPQLAQKAGIGRLNTTEAPEAAEE